MKSNNQTIGRATTPPMSSGFKYKSIRFVKNFPDALFQLPSGTKVIIPQSLANTPLPKGVKREMMKGPSSGYGISE